jgi:hypothetical protein
MPEYDDSLKTAEAKRTVRPPAPRQDGPSPGALTAVQRTPNGASPSDVFSLQQSIGNQAVAGLVGAQRMGEEDELEEEQTQSLREGQPAGVQRMGEEDELEEEGAG